ITASARAGDSADVTAKVTELRALAPAGAKGFAPNLSATTKVGGKEKAESFFSRKRLETLAIVHGSSVIFVATAFFVALAGLFTLYATNGAQIGAAPLADTLTLFAWGIASDVAGRTLANFRGS
ncbi:MAG: hypothetical protein GY736_03515, partial [Sphingomonas sp.]|uniref:hypothetical protein n=1 Tax=Sphingomonas sp. TaxID=28214 RepID=UPI00258DAD60